MTNVTNTLPVLPPEIVRLIVRLVASDMDRHVLLTLGMTSRYCAGLFAGLYYNNWEVDCCSYIQTATIHESNDIYNSTNMDWFFRALKSGFAPAYAKRVYFYFCTHPQPVNHAKCSESNLQTNWPLEQTGEFLKLLNVSEIVVTIRDPHKLGYICNEPFLRALLRDSLCELPNAVVKLRVDNWEAPRLNSDLFYFTIRGSSTPQAAVADNLQRALGQIRPSSIDHDLWDESELYTFSLRHVRHIFDIYPNVRNLSLSHNDDDIFAGQGEQSYLVARPEEYLTAFPQCQWLTCRWKKPGHRGCFETTFCFDNVSAQGRQCTKMSVHSELGTWILQALADRVVLRQVKELEFHHIEHKAFLSPSWISYTPSRLNSLLACLLFPFPNLERMILKFGPDMIILGTNHSGTLRKDFCEHCELAVNIVEFDIRTMVREGRLSAVKPTFDATLDRLFEVWSDDSSDKAEYSEFISHRNARIIRTFYATSVSPYVIHRSKL